MQTKLAAVTAALVLLAAAPVLGQSQPAPAAVASGAVSVMQPWARATPPGAKVGAAYMELKAGGAGADRLLGVSSDVAEAVELHTHTMDGGVARMRRVDDIPVPAGGAVALSPGGYHIMLINLKRQLKAGETVRLTLQFEKAGRVVVDAAVQPIGATGAGAAGVGHSGHARH